MRALSRPTQATGTPGRHLHDREHRVQPAQRRLGGVSGTPMTGRSVCAAATPGQRGRQPGAGDDHAQPAHAARCAVVGDDVGVAVRGHHADLVQDARARSSTFAAFSIAAMSDFEPMMMPTRGASTVELLELGLGSVSDASPVCASARLMSALHGPQRDVAAQLTALEGDQVGGSIGGVAGGAGVVAERRDVQHAAAGGDDRAVAPARVPAWVTSTPARHARRGRR